MALDVAAASMPRNSASPSIVPTPGVSTSAGAASDSGNSGRARNAARDLEVGRVVPALARDEHVLARPRRCEVVDRLVAAHHPRLRLHGIGLEPAALEHPVVRVEVLAKADVETFVVTVERVGVLHHELAHAEQRSARTRLVAHLRLDVVEDLRQLLVRLQLARVERDRLLVRQREDERAAVAVLDLPELGNVVAPGRLPELRRRHDRHEHLLPADRVHLLADDLDDLLVDPPTEREERPEAGAHLSDEPAAHEQLVARGLRVGGSVAQGRQKEL